MKEKLSIVLVAIIILANTIGVNATTKTIAIPRLGYGETKLSATRTGKYSYVQARCKAVYPQGSYDSDTFTKIRVKIRDEYDTLMSDYLALTEGKALSNITLFEGYLDIKKIKFCFYGNSTEYPATAEVEYLAK